MSSPPLTLMLEFARAEQTADPYGFRFAPQDYLLRTAGGGFKQAHFSWDQALLADLNTARQPGGDPVVLPRLGEVLRGFLDALGWENMAAQLLDAHRQGRRVLLTVRSAAAELYALPWELLTLKSTGQHVGELPGVLLRYEWPETTTISEQPTPRHGGGRILLAWSAAGGAVPAAEHVNAISTACRLGAYSFDPVQDTLAHVSLAQLSSILAAAKRNNQPISVLHLLAHGGAAGGTFGIVFNDESAEGASTVIADAGRLRQILAPYANMVRLVVLMACDSGNVGGLGNQLGSVAQTLHRAGIASVVASRYPLSVAGSVRLAQSLYRGLLQGPDSLESALLTARGELVQDAGQFDWACIQLYARAADGEDTRPLVFRPYQGLDSFGIEQRRFFFGRKALTDKLWQRCQALFTEAGATRLLAILGPSGSGKSSVARAGLLAELEHRPLPCAQRITVFRPGDHPQQALEPALAEQQGEKPEATLLVLVDQFEEVYSLCTDPKERDTFVAWLLKAASDPAGRISVVLTLRSDFLGETQRQHPELNRLFGDQAVLVTAMSQDELRAAIVEPAAQAGQPMDEVIAQQLLTEARGADGALPLLEFALARIWEGMLADKEPAATLREIGGVGGALASKAQQLYEALSTPEQATTQRAMVRLVRLGEGTRDTRRRAPISELCGRGETEDRVLSVLRKFATENARLVTLSAAGAEVTHEALFEHWTKLRHWIDASREDRRLHDRATEAARLWEKDQRPPGRLWRRPDLDLLRDYQKRKPEELSPLLEAFLHSSKRQQQREKWIRWGSAVALFVALVVAAAIYVTEERQRRREADVASERIQKQLLDTYVEQGRQLLLEKDNPAAALLWLHRAQARHSTHPALLYLLREALFEVEATHAILLGHHSDVLAATYSPDGKRIVTASDDQTARVWDAESGRLLATLEGDERMLSAMYSPDGKRIVTANRDQTARVWDAETGRLLKVLPNESSRFIPTYSPDGKRIVIVGLSGLALLLWDVEFDYVPASARLRHGHLVVTARYGLDGKRIVTISYDGTARTWDAENGRLLAVLKGHDFTTAAYSPDGKHIVTASSDGTARTWDAENGRLLAVLKGHGDIVTTATHSPDGNRIVTASAETARVWDATTGHLLVELKGHTDKINTATYSPDGKHIVTASRDTTARVWKAETGHLLAELKSPGDMATTATYSPNGKRIVTISYDKTGRVWEADTGHLLAEPGGPGAFVSVPMHSPDGKRIITAADDKTAMGTDRETQRWHATQEGHSPVLWTPKQSPDGKRIVTVLDAKVAEAMGKDEWFRNLGIITTATSRPYGKCIVTTSTDKTARVWEADTGRLLAVLKGHGDIVTAATYSPDGKRIVTASADKTARVWDVAPESRVAGEIEKIIRCKLAVRFASEDSNVIIATQPNPAECLPQLSPLPNPSLPSPSK